MLLRPIGTTQELVGMVVVGDAHLYGRLCAITVEVKGSWNGAVPKEVLMVSGWRCWRPMVQVSTININVDVGRR